MPKPNLAHIVECLESVNANCDQLLDALGVDNLVNARRRVIAMRRELDETREQLQQFVDVLGGKHWHNALVRARNLCRQVEEVDP
jgi:hypothetical protein